MTATTHPAPNVLRAYLAKRHEEKTPPPSLEEIRRQLGWWLEVNNKPMECAR